MTMGKVLKLYKTIFTILHLVVVVVVQFHKHNSLTVLVISTKLCEYNIFSYEDVHRHIFCKQCSSCKTTTNSPRQYITIGT